MNVALFHEKRKWYFCTWVRWKLLFELAYKDSYNKLTVLVKVIFKLPNFSFLQFIILHFFALQVWFLSTYVTNTQRVLIFPMVTSLSINVQHKDISTQYSCTCSLSLDSRESFWLKQKVQILDGTGFKMYQTMEPWQVLLPGSIVDATWQIDMG